MWSLRRLGCGSLLGALFVCSAIADAAPPFLAADTRDTQKLVADRAGFLRDVYQLDDASMKRMSDWLSSQAPLHDRYQAEVHKTSYRINLAMTIVRGDSNLHEADRAERLTTLQAQLARLLSRGPLSLASVMKTAEAGMAADKVAAAHQRLQVKLASQMKAGGSIDLASVDALLVTPATTVTKLDSPPPSVPARPVARMDQSSHTDADGHNHSATTPTPTPPIAGTAQSAPPKPQPMRPPVNPVQVTPIPAPPPAPPKVYPPAPPEAEWSAYTMKTSDKFGFTPDQKRAALNALKHCRDRASAYREEKKAAYNEATKSADPKVKTEKLTELNKTLDGLYDELTQRIDNIASIEQKNKVANPPTATQKS